MVESFDLHKAVEAQGFIALAAIRNQIEAAIPDDRVPEISAWLDVLTTMLLCQGHPTRDCRDMAHYSDGSPVFRLVPDDTLADVEARDFLDDCDDKFDYLGEVAKHLFSATLNTGYRVEVNDPPISEPREPSYLVKLWRERYPTSLVVDGGVGSGGDGHGEGG